MKKNRELNELIGKYESLKIKDNVMDVVNKRIRDILDELLEGHQYLYYEKTFRTRIGNYNRYFSNSIDLCVPRDMLVRQIFKQISQISWHCTPHQYSNKVRVYVKVFEYTNNKTEWVFDEIFEIEELIKKKPGFLGFGEKEVFNPYPIETMMDVYRKHIQEYLRYTIEIKEIY